MKVKTKFLSQERVTELGEAAFSNFTGSAEGRMETLEETTERAVETLSLLIGVLAEKGILNKDDLNRILSHTTILEIIDNPLDPTP